MYAKITTSRSLVEILRYHELKVKRGRAELLLAGNAIKEQEQLDWKDKLYHFQRLNVRNESAENNTLHISLSFHPSEELSNAKMQVIAREYIQKMRLGHQPFLAYRHFDTVHPHLHIVSSSIQEDGNKIHLRLINYYESIKITTELEKTHSLTPFRTGLPNDERLRLYPLQKVVYGKTALYPTFNRVIKAVIDNYKFTSLAEFNALLGLYNIEAYRGKASSFLYQHKGLLYKPVQENGEHIAAHFKASELAGRPTLANLEKQFLLHRFDIFRRLHQRRIAKALDDILFHSPLTLTGFSTALANERISAVMQKDKKGTVQNIFYIDQQTQSVFEASTLGPGYTATALYERLLPETSLEQLIQRLNEPWQSMQQQPLSIQQQVQSTEPQPQSLRLQPQTPEQQLKALRLQPQPPQQQLQPSPQPEIPLTLRQRILQKQQKSRRHGLRH